MSMTGQGPSCGSLGTSSERQPFQKRRLSWGLSVTQLALPVPATLPPGDLRVPAVLCQHPGQWCLGQEEGAEQHGETRCQ